MRQAEFMSFINSSSSNDRVEVRKRHKDCLRMAYLQCLLCLSLYLSTARFKLIHSRWLESKLEDDFDYTRSGCLHGDYRHSFKPSNGLTKIYCSSGIFHTEVKQLQEWTVSAGVVFSGRFDGSFWIIDLQIVLALHSLMNSIFIKLYINPNVLFFYCVQSYHHFEDCFFLPVRIKMYDK